MRGICVWFCEAKQEFNRHEESSFFSGASGGRRSASAAVDGATAIPHLGGGAAAAAAALKRGSTELKKAGKGSNGVAINKSHTPPGY